MSETPETVVPTTVPEPPAPPTEVRPNKFKRYAIYGAATAAVVGAVLWLKGRSSDDEDEFESVDNDNSTDDTV